MTGKSAKIIIIVLFSLLLVSGCTGDIQPQATTETPAPTITETVTPTATSTRRPTSAPTATPIVFPTYEPVTQEERIIWLDEKLNQPECNLPCIWGVTLGITTVLDAYQIGAPYATKILSDRSTSKYNGFTFLYGISPREYDDPLFNFYYRYNETGIIFTQLWDLSDYSIYDAKNILTQYGPPEEIWINAWSTDPGFDYESRGSLIFLSYSSQKFLVEYWEAESEVIGENVKTCLNNGPIISSWSENYSDVEETLIQVSNLWPSIRLEDVTGITPEEFYDAFVNTTGDVCIETPLDTWLASKSGKFD